MTDTAQPDRQNYALVGFQAGLMAAVLVWCFPLPIAFVIWLFQLKGLFADYMYMAIPFILALPFFGGVIGLFIVRSDGKHG